MTRGIGMGLSLTLIVVGAVLAWAITWTSDNIDLEVTGYIIFGTGIFGLAVWIVNALIQRWALRTGRFHSAPAPYGTARPQGDPPRR